MSSHSPRDTIQISLGPSANAITAHSLNLQGLAATSSDEETNVCDPQTTHFLRENRWNPRVLLVDEPTRFFVSSQVSSQALSSPSPSAQHQLTPSWGGIIEPLDPSLMLQHEESQWSQFLDSTTILANSSYSRYYQEPEVRNTFQTDSSNPRHVVWDDEEEEEEEEEDPIDRLARMQQQKTRWKQQTEGPIQEQLDAWAENLKSSTTETNTPTSWMEYLMPPYSSQCKVPLPYSHQSRMTAHWDSYMTQNLNEWKEDVLFERLRHLLEQCDACQGVCITTEGYGIYAGLATSLLQEFQEECRSAGRMIYHVTNPIETAPNNIESEDTDETPWQVAHVDRLRKNLSTGLALNDFTQNAHTVLPLRLESDKSLFEASAKVAMALESATLPFRLNSHHDPRYKIGLQNAPFFGQGGGDSRWGTTAQRLTIWEYISCLQPQSQYSILELNTIGENSLSNTDVWNRFKEGTSVERDQRMREGGRDAPRSRPRDSLPGSWLQDTKHGGILSSLSLDKVTDRSLHYHFALSTSVRPVLESDLSQYMTCLVQGMGIRYRPERSMCTVLDQTIGNLTTAGYGAGAYWKSLISQEDPVVAVLGNTTRVYPYLNSISSNMKMVLGPRYRGFYNRDVLNEVLPEAEDCQDALEKCYDMRDAYLPPEGSGLVEDDGDIDI